jgi:hypothetical protein
MSEIDRVTEWLRKNTTIVNILEQRVSHDQLKKWSDVLRQGHFDRGYHNKITSPPDLESRKELVTFVDTVASILQNENPEVAALINKNLNVFELSKKIHCNKSYMKDPFTLAVVCGLRILQEREGFNKGKGIINFIRYRENKGLFT